jgi:hypothetical protein
MFRVFSRPSSGAQWLQWQPLVLPSHRGDNRAVFVVQLYCSRGKTKCIIYSVLLQPSYPARQSSAPCYNVTCGLYGCSISFPHYLVNEKILWNMLPNTKCVVIFSTNFVSNISHSKKNWARNYHECPQAFTWSTRYSCQNLMKFEFSRRIF